MGTFHRKSKTGTRIVQILIFACLILFGLGGSSVQNRIEAKAAGKAGPGYSDGTLRNRVSGIFIVPELSFDATDEQWYQALKNMKDIGIDTVIVQYSYRTGSHGSQAYFPYEQQDTQAGTADAERKRSVIPSVLTAADRLNMKVFAGLQISENEWFDKDMFKDDGWLREQSRLSLSLARSLWDQYGSRYGKVLTGWYLPFEFESAEEYYPYYQQIAEQYYAPLTAGLKKDNSCGKLDVMVSPLMFRNSDMTAWQDGVKAILAGSQIDIIAPQDGIGYGTQTHGSVGPWIQATRQAVDEVNQNWGRKVKMWVNCENYAREQSGGIPESLAGKMPMSINKFIESMEVAAPYADKLITFSIHRWDTVLESSLAEVNKSYYEAYKEYYTNGTKPVGLAGGYYVDICPAQDGTLTVNEYAKAGLTDGSAREEGKWEEYRGIRSEGRKPFTMEIRFDDPVRISRISSNYYAESKAHIMLPEKVRYEYISQMSYVNFYTDTFTQQEGVSKSEAAPAEPVAADGIRITVFPGGSWTFLDDIRVE